MKPAETTWWTLTESWPRPADSGDRGAPLSASRVLRNRVAASLCPSMAAWAASEQWWMPLQKHGELSLRHCQVENSPSKHFQANILVFET